MKQQVVFKKFTQTKVNTKGKDIPPCSTCKDTTCVLLPRFKNWPCYQGPPKDAALCYNTKSTKLSRMHNNANVMAIGSRLTKKKTALKLVSIFFETKFEGGRHLRRVKKI